MNYNTINGYTKESIIEKIKSDFKGKAANGGQCLYLTEDSKKMCHWFIYSRRA